MGEVDGQIAVLEKQNDALLSRFVKARTQTGRDLNNLKILASRTMDPVTWLHQGAEPGRARREGPESRSSGRRSPT
jgi:hypothetical protein